MTAANTNHPWWKGSVIYQIYPLSFFDANGDGIGDLPGVIDKLDYVAGLGVDAIWLSPFFLSPMDDFGYDVADFRRVDPRFGHDEDADRLITQAHARGLKVIFDFVLCHTSDRHDWFTESRASRTNPKADWYVWADARADGTPPNNWQSVFGGASWDWGPQRGQYYLHHFLKSQPALNWRNPDVERAVHAEMAHWFDRGVDGMRLDSISRLVVDAGLRDNPPRPRDDAEHFVGSRLSPYNMQQHIYDRQQPEILGFLERLRRFADRWADRFLLGEVADGHGTTASLYAAPGRMHSNYTFQFAQPVFDADFLKTMIAADVAAAGPAWLTYSLGNHDLVRIVSRWGSLPHLTGDGSALAKLVTALTVCLRGSACLYQGDELALPEADVPFDRLADPFGIALWPDFKGRDGSRTPMPWCADEPNAGFSTAEPWLPLAEDHRALAVDRQDTDPKSPLALCRTLLAWRKRQPALIHGDLELLEPQSPVLAFVRSIGADRVICAFNISNAAVSWQPPGRWRPLAGHGFEAVWRDETVSLPPFGAAFGAPG